MVEIPLVLNDDSEDFTDEEVEAAVPVTNEDGLIEHFKKVACGECELPMQPNKHALRRRAPFMYSRVRMECGRNHTQTVVLRLDWLSI